MWLFAILVAHAVVIECYIVGLRFYTEQLNS